MKCACAPRGASSYPRRSREELGGRFLGPMAYLDPKGEGNRSMPGKRRSCLGGRSEPPRIFRRENQLGSFLFGKEKGNGDGEAAQVVHAGIQGPDRSDGGRGVPGDSVDGAGDRRERADLA